MPYEQRLTGMVFFSLENNSFRRDLVAAFEYLQDYQENGAMDKALNNMV